MASTPAPSDSPVIGNALIANVDIKENKSVVKAGINFKFDPGSVIGRY